MIGVCKSITAAVLLMLLVVGSLAFAQRPADRLSIKTEIDSSRLLDDLKILSADDMEGRSADRPSIEKARVYVEKRFRESGLTAFGTTFRQEFKIKLRDQTEVTGANFIGLIKGKKYPDKYIVLTAHYDHVGISGGQIFNGADDNASGTAALFAISQVLAKQRPDHSVIVVALDAEERGFLGSKYFLENPPVNKTAFVLNINLDMVSRNAKGELYAAGAFHYPKLRPILEGAQKVAKVKLLLGHDNPKLGANDWTGQSDHAVFHAAKIPFVYFGVEDHADYHRPGDDFDKINADFYVRSVETILSSLRLLDKNLGR